MAGSFKVVVFVPVQDAEAVRQAAGRAGAGKLGNYSFCSFSSTGVGRFLPGDGAKPAIGEVGTVEEVSEERIEFTCAAESLAAVVAAIKSAHPYEEVALDIYQLFTPS
jgi:hypothetical protein